MVNVNLYETENGRFVLRFRCEQGLLHKCEHLKRNFVILYFIRTSLIHVTFMYVTRNINTNATASR
jgi:hypothetical protein